MKKFYLLAAIAMLTACSAPKKYSYYFDHQPVKPKLAETTETKKADVKTSDIESTQQPLYASTDVTKTPIVKEAPAPVITKTSESTVNVTPSNKTKREFKHEAKQKLKSLVRQLKKAPEGTTATKGTNNGFAIAGFVCSIVGFLVLWPLCILGIIFSAIGLKSEKRGLAIAGLVIGVIGVVIVLVVGAALISG